MSITLKVDGIEYDGFTSVNVSKSLQTIAGEFSFECTIQDPADFPIKVGSACSVYINSVQIIEGFIEKMDCETSADSHSINISGRDKTCDIIDSLIFQNIEFKSSITLVNLIKKILSKNNITNINVINNAGVIDKFTNKDSVSTELSSNLFETIEKLCRSRQVIITNDGKGNISLERASKIEIKRYLLNELSGLKNNIKNIRVSIDHSERFYKTIVKNQGNPTTGFVSGDNLTNIKGSSTDKEIRNTRNRLIFSDNSVSSKIAKKMADWHSNIARARSFIVDLEIQGFSYDENDETKIWRPNNLISIKDDFWDINAQMLITDVNYSFSNNGSIVGLKLLTRDAFTLSENEDNIFKKKEKKSNALLSSLGLA